MSRAKAPVKGRTGKRKQCMLCHQRRPYTLDDAGDIRLDTHYTEGELAKPADRRTPCLGSGSAAVQA